MSTLNNQLPGFETPGSPKADNRLFAPASGKWTFPFLENLPLTQPMDDYKIYVDYEYGQRIINLAVINNPAIKAVKNENDTQTFMVSLDLIQFQSWPGTYVLRGMDSPGNQVFYKTFTVLANPSLPPAVFPNFDTDSGFNAFPWPQETGH